MLLFWNSIRKIVSMSSVSVYQLYQCINNVKCQVYQLRVWYQKPWLSLAKGKLTSWQCIMTSIRHVNKKTCVNENSVPNKRFSVGWSMSWGSEGHFEVPLVQESWIFLLPRSTKNGQNQCWFILYHIYIRYSHEK